MCMLDSPASSVQMNTFPSSRHRLVCDDKTKGLQSLLGHVYLFLYVCVCVYISQPNGLGYLLCYLGD